MCRGEEALLQLCRPCLRLRSEALPRATIRPSWMMTTLSHIISTSLRMWVERRTVRSLPRIAWAGLVAGRQGDWTARLLAALMTEAS